MSGLTRLDYILMKQRDIVNQIIECKEKIESGKSIEMIGNHDITTPQELLNFHKERYNILEVAKNCSENTLRDWVGCVKIRPTFSYRDRVELALLEGCLNG